MASSRLKLLDACLKKYAKQKRNEKFQFQRMDRPPERLQSLKSFNQNICSMNAPDLRLIWDLVFGLNLYMQCHSENRKFILIGDSQ